MAGGRTPSLEEVADAALVSRTTAYRSFPNWEAPLIGTPPDGVRDEVEAVSVTTCAAADDPSVPLATLGCVFQRRVVTQKHAFPPYCTCRGGGGEPVDRLRPA